MQEKKLEVCHYEKQKELILNTNIIIPRRMHCSSVHDILQFCWTLHHPNVLMKDENGHVVCTDIEYMKHMLSSVHVQAFILEESLVHTQRQLIPFTGYRMLWNNNSFRFSQRMIHVNTSSLTKLSPVLSVYAKHKTEYSISNIYQTLVKFIRTNQSVLGNSGYMDICYLHKSQKICVPDIFCRNSS